LDKAIEELTLTRGVLKEEYKDAIGYYDEVAKKMEKTIWTNGRMKEPQM
jgi:hypothetical protein